MLKVSSVSKPFEQYVNESLQELQQKTLDQIQVETALKWCSRAIASARLRRPERETTEYAHEALEHAALSSMDDLLPYVREMLRQHRIQT